MQEAGLDDPLWSRPTWTILNILRLLCTISVLGHISECNISLQPVLLHLSSHCTLYTSNKQAFKNTYMHKCTHHIYLFLFSFSVFLIWKEELNYLIWVVFIAFYLSLSSKRYWELNDWKKSQTFLKNHATLDCLLKKNLSKRLLGLEFGV